MAQTLRAEWKGEPGSAAMKFKSDDEDALDFDAMLGLQDGEGEYERLTSRLRSGTQRKKKEDQDMLNKFLLSQAKGKRGNADDVMKLLMLQMLHRQQKRDDDSVEAGGKAFRRIHNLKARVENEPGRLVSEYLTEVMEKLGVEDGDVWQLWHWTERISWGKMLGLKRVHWHLSHILSLSLKGKKREAEAYSTQLLRGLRQVVLDGGSWDTASLLLPARDPCAREVFGATERELEAVVAYQRAMKDIRKPWAPAVPPEDAPDGKGGKGKKGLGKGKDNADQPQQ